LARYECDVCGTIFDEEKEGMKWDELPAGWHCPVCESDKSYFQNMDGSGDGGEAVSPTVPVRSGETSGYLSEWRRHADSRELYMDDIHRMAETGSSIIEPMRTGKPVISWDQILIKGAQLARIPRDKDSPVNTSTVIGPKAKHPLLLGTPIFITHMSFGAISREAKMALAKGSAAVKTAMCSGEGGLLEESFQAAYGYIFEYVPNQYSVTQENLRKVDAIEIKFGQSTKPGMGGHQPGSKVTEEIARIRGFQPGEDIIGPSNFPDIQNREDLKKKVDQLRDESGGKPIGIKIAAGNIEADMEQIVHARPDFITVDGRPGATGASPKFIKEATSVPTLFALYRAGKFLQEKGVKDMSLIITGGLRVSSDFAKALALGADAVAIGTAALMAVGCQQYRSCNTGKCPVGITTQDPELRSRLDVELSAERVANFLRVSTEELEEFARLTGNDDVHKLDIADLCTTNSEISDHTDIEHV